MATKSICKNVSIRSVSLSRKLINALENAKDKESKEVVISKECRELKGESIKLLFGDK